MEKTIILYYDFLENERFERESMLHYFEAEALRIFNQNFQDLEYSIESNNKWKDITLKYNNKNKLKYLIDLEKSDDKGFSLNIYLDNLKNKSEDIKMCVHLESSNKDNNGISRLTIGFNQKCYLNQWTLTDLNKFYLDTVHFLQSENNSIRYGFIFSMENNKFPMLFANGIGSYNLIISEEISLDKWANCRQLADEKVWSVFYLNLITEKHLKNGASLEQLINEVGKENIKILSGAILMNFENAKLNFGEKNSNQLKVLDLLNLC